MVYESTASNPSQTKSILTGESPYLEHEPSPSQDLPAEYENPKHPPHESELSETLRLGGLVCANFWSFPLREKSREESR